jgi:hypothetical protein
LSSAGLAPMALRTLVIPAGLVGSMAIGLGGSAPMALSAPVIETAGAGFLEGLGGIGRGLQEIQILLYLV